MTFFIIKIAINSKLMDENSFNVQTFVQTGVNYWL